MQFQHREKKGQVWIESILYTLIGLALIGVTLAIVTPKITESRDRIVVEQSIDSLNKIAEKIDIVIDTGPGNVRKISEFTMRRGELYFNSTEDKIILILSDLKNSYSEPGTAIQIGAVIVVSEEKARSSSVRLILNYQEKANLTFGGKDETKKFNPSSTPYSISIENRGRIDNNKLVINIEQA